MRAPPLLAVVAVASIGVMGATRVQAAATDNGPWLTALSSKFVVVDLAKGDLNGDGADETLVCYREDVERTDQRSGVAVYTGKGTDLTPVFHVQLEAMCEKVKVSGRKLGILLTGNKQLVWTYGDDLKFRREKGSGLASMTVKASSSAPAYPPEKVIDGDIGTSWAEGTSGTGLGQKITLRLPRPMNIGVIGIYSGIGSSSRSFFDSNRIHRGSMEAKTEADLGDTAAGIDFSALGIDSIGDRIDFTCENKPGVTYINVDKRGVVELQFRIESVYLGDKKDDTHIAEIEVVPLLGLGETLDKATQLKAKESSSGNGKTDAKKSEPKEDTKAHDDAVKKLDEGGRSMIEDDL
jgi:hypothetical protein